MSTTDKPSGNASDKTPRPRSRPVATEAPFLARLAEAMAETEGVVKDGFNQEHKYKFASAEAILSAVRKPLLSRGVILTQHIAEVERKEIVSRGGSRGEEITVHVDFTFRDGRSEEHLTSRWVGVGQDYGDKAIGKALTSAVKTFVRGTWLLPTEHDDPERDAPTTPMASREAAEDQVREVLAALAPHIGADNAKRLLAFVQRDTNGSPITVGQTVALSHVAQALVAVGAPADPQADQDIARQNQAGEEPQAPSGHVAAEITAEVAAPAPAPAKKAPAKKAAAKAKPTPASVPMPHFDGSESYEEAIELMRGSGCTCDDPTSEPHDGACPLIGHGQVL